MESQDEWFPWGCLWQGAEELTKSNGGGKMALSGNESLLYQSGHLQKGDL